MKNKELLLVILKKVFPKEDESVNKR